MYAARGNHPHSCQELLLHGADFRLTNLNGDTAHVIAVDNNSTLGNYKIKKIKNLRLFSAQAVITNFIISQLDPGS